MIDFQSIELINKIITTVSFIQDNILMQFFFAVNIYKKYALTSQQKSSSTTFIITLHKPALSPSI